MINIFIFTIFDHLATKKVFVDCNNWKHIFSSKDGGVFQHILALFDFGVDRLSISDHFYGKVDVFWWVMWV